MNSKILSSTCLGHLDLGDTGKSQDMLKCYPLHTWEMIYSLQKHDFAFILRSNGSWTYAIIADRQEESIRFVVNTTGSTKTLFTRRWLDSIRVVNTRSNRRRFYTLPTSPEADPPGIKLSPSLPGDLRLVGGKEQDVGCVGHLPGIIRTRRESVVSLLGLYE